VNPRLLAWGFIVERVTRIELALGGHMAADLRRCVVPL
jgi:hypothetical protein